MAAVGDVLAGRYRVDAVLGAGGMATVYRATDLRLEREVAVKMLLSNLARDPSLAERFDREARLLASVAHPSIAAVFDVEPGDPDAGREPFYVMELCDGGSLADRIGATGRVEPGELVPLILAIAAGLGELHRQGLIHRDVKPGNILFTDGRPKLADFGLAKSDTATPATPTETGIAIGTPAYMAPELVHGEPATTASDVYALAATTFHGLTGRAHRQAETLTELISTVSQSPPRASSVSPVLGTAFDELLSASLAMDPGDRPTLNAFTAGLVAAVGRASEPAARAPAAGAGVGTTAQVSPVDPLADTSRIPTTSPPTLVAAGGRSSGGPREQRATRTTRRPGQLLPALVVVLLAGLVVVALAVMVASGPGSGGATSSPPASPSPSPTGTPTPSPTPELRLAVLRALDEVSTAIEQARGGPDGLGGKDAQELLRQNDEVRKRVTSGELDKAREAAVKLEEQARHVSDQIDDERARAVLEAIRDLEELLDRLASSG